MWVHCPDATGQNPAAPAWSQPRCRKATQRVQRCRHGLQPFHLLQKKNCVSPGISLQHMPAAYACSMLSTPAPQTTSPSVLPACPRLNNDKLTDLTSAWMRMDRSEGSEDPCPPLDVDCGGDAKARGLGDPGGVAPKRSEALLQIPTRGDYCATPTQPLVHWQVPHTMPSSSDSVPACFIPVCIACARALTRKKGEEGNWMCPSARESLPLSHAHAIPAGPVALHP